MKKFIKSINNEKYSPPLCTDDILRSVQFESKYIPVSDEYIVKYISEGTMDIMEVIIYI